MLLLIGFAFLAGIVTILSPCILPVLPIVLSGSVSGGKRKAYGVVVGFVVSFAFFTLFLTQLVVWTGLSADAVRNLAVVILILFGLTMLVLKIQAWMELLFSKLSALAPKTSGSSGFGSGLLLGLTLGLLWTPCVGPILAAVISLSIVGSVSGASVLIVTAFALGTALPMLGIILGGQAVMTRMPVLRRNSAKIQQVFGVLMILTALMIYFQYDRKFQSYILDAFPQYGTGLTRFEENNLVDERLRILRGEEAGMEEEMVGKPLTMPEETGESLPVLFTAPELQTGGEWFGGTPVTMEELRGKVVLIDFWTYSCINCIRTLPYLREWHEKYADEGLVIIGVHAPEFAFEREADNVAQAIDDFGLEYLVMQDNDFATWQAYENRYWPAKYLVDQEGRVRYQHFGEGKYVETENAIRELLGEAAVVGEDERSSRRRQTPEIYLGYERAEQYMPGLGIEPDVMKEYLGVEPVADDGVSLSGSWLVGEEAITARENGAGLTLSALGSQVYLVMEPSEDGPGTVEVLLDGEQLPIKFWTGDMDGNGQIRVTEARKYDVVDFGEDYGRYVITLVFDEGVSVFAFTFGSFN
jgi:cytochrome c biogenesis protein CcdA/thiol-disulfide isomerase/thioredoxin